MSIPSEITEFCQWTSCYPKESSRPKRPIVDPDKFMNAFPFEEVEKEKTYYGFIFSPVDPFVIIDIDNDKKNPVSIEALLAATPQWIQDLAAKSYTEISPSGHGLHILAKVPEGAKKQVSRAYFKAIDFEGQVSIQNAFMTFTGQAYNGSSKNIETVQMADLAKYFKMSTKTEQVEVTVDFDKKSVPEVSKIRRYMEVIPLDQSPRVVKAYEEITGQTYEHYDFWIMIGMALHDYGTIASEMPECFELFLVWSKSDPEAFESEQDVFDHWKSFSSKDEKISYKTLIKFASKFEFDWPYPVMSKGKKTGNPIPGEYKNFEYLMEYYNLRIIRDKSSGSLFMTGQEDICEKYFNTFQTEKFFGKFYGPYHLEALATSFLRLCQDNRYRSTTLRLIFELVKVVMNTAIEEEDLMSTWLDTPFEKLPADLQINGQYTKTSTLDYILECIEVAPTMQDCKDTLVRSILKKWFMGLIKLREPVSQPFDQNGGMLFFIGPENSRKTTFFNMILPKPLANIGFIKTVNTNLRGDKDQRDFLRSLGSRVLVILDEYDGLNQTFLDAQLKNLITTNDVTFTDIYQTTERRCERSAMLCATSNSYKQRLSRNGTRRMWCIQVKWIDTGKLLNFNWHHFYRELREEFRRETSRGRTPWLLTPTEIEVLNSYNVGVTAQTDLSIMLESTFDFEMPFPGFKKITSVQQDKTGMLMKTPDILNILRFKFPNSKTIKLSALENELSRSCGIWTKTHNDMKQLVKPRAVVHSGKIIQGKYTRWIVPPTVTISSE